MTQRLKLQTGTSVNLLVYSLFMIIAVTGIVYGNAIKSDLPLLRVWGYPNILALLIGTPFLFLQSKVGLPDFLDESVSNRQRFLKPALLGAVFGILDVVVIKFLMHPEPYAELPPFLQPFPYSIFLYFSGAFEIEVFYRLIPFTLILLTGKWFAGGKYLKAFSWTAVILTSLREPFEQLPDGRAWFVVYSLLTGFMMNFLQGMQFKKAGLLASLAVRLGHYLFWHILLGVYVEYFELQ